jgi:8-oxo-dGTP diphosphatase
MDRYRLNAGAPANGWLASFLPHLAVDCVVFGFHDGDLKILLLKWRGADVWALPGGFIGKRESIDAAASRALRARTGLKRIHLRQFHASGELGRKEASLRKLFLLNGSEVSRKHWLFERVISVGYLALVDFQKVKPVPEGPWAESCNWYPLDSHPPLAFDHDRMVARALQTLREDLANPGAGSHLMPERFTMPELQRLHEAILGRRLDRRNFQKRVLDRGDIERLDMRRTGGAHRAPFLYRFVRSVPEKALDR